MSRGGHSRSILEGDNLTPAVVEHVRMGWEHLANTSDFERRSVVGRASDSRLIAIYRVDGTYYATSDICTHASARLSQGEVVDGYIECPLHFGLFDIATGKAQGAPVVRDLITFPVKLVGTKILVDVPDGPS